jgi:hypothetical protein
MHKFLEKPGIWCLRPFSIFYNGFLLLNRLTIQSHLLYIVFIFFLSTQTAYAIVTDKEYGAQFLNITFLQANLGGGNFTATDSTVNPVNSALPLKVNFKSSGLHAALNLTDYNKFAPDWFLGGRAGGQIFSNLRDTAIIPDPLSINDFTRSYSLQLLGGFFGDVLIAKDWPDDHFYLLSFFGLAYDQYHLKEFQTPFYGVKAETRNNLLWAVGARAGAGIGIHFMKSYIAGVEYTHRFNQRIGGSSYNDKYTADQSHLIKAHGNSIDLVCAVMLRD